MYYTRYHSRYCFPKLCIAVSGLTTWTILFRLFLDNTMRNTRSYSIGLIDILSFSVIHSCYSELCVIYCKFPCLPFN